jgi:hypothetical protein
MGRLSRRRVCFLRSPLAWLTNGEYHPITVAPVSRPKSPIHFNRASSPMPAINRWMRFWSFWKEERHLDHQRGRLPRRLQAEQLEDRTVLSALSLTSSTLAPLAVHAPSNGQAHSGAEQSAVPTPSTSSMSQSGPPQTPSPAPMQPTASTAPSTTGPSSASAPQPQNQALTSPQAASQPNQAPPSPVGAQDRLSNSAGASPVNEASAPPPPPPAPPSNQGSAPSGPEGASTSNPPLAPPPSQENMGQFGPGSALPSNNPPGAPPNPASGRQFAQEGTPSHSVPSTNPTSAPASEQQSTPLNPTQPVEPSNQLPPPTSSSSGSAPATASPNQPGAPQATQAANPSSLQPTAPAENPPPLPAPAPPVPESHGFAPQVNPLQLPLLPDPVQPVIASSTLREAAPPPARSIPSVNEGNALSQAPFVAPVVARDVTTVTPSLAPPAPTTAGAAHAVEAANTLTPPASGNATGVLGSAQAGVTNLPVTLPALAAEVEHAVPLVTQVPPLVRPEAVSGDPSRLQASPLRLIPALGLPIADVLPIDVTALERGMEQFVQQFERFTGVTLTRGRSTLTPWLASAAAAALAAEIARRYLRPHEREDPFTPDPDDPSSWPTGWTAPALPKRS